MVEGAWVEEDVKLRRGGRVVRVEVEAQRQVAAAGYWLDDGAGCVADPPGLRWQVAQRYVLQHGFAEVVLAVAVRVLVFGRSCNKRRHGLHAGACQGAGRGRAVERYGGSGLVGGRDCTASILFILYV